jgi:hypothetical protein
VVGDQAQQQDAQQAAEERMSRPRVVDVPMAQAGQLARLVAQFAVDPTCPQCGGPAQLQAGPDAVDVAIDHRDGCRMLDEAA